MQTQPLAGIRVLDLTQIFQGPYASFLMAMAGADVVNVASRLEELTRRLDASVVVSDDLIEAVRAAGGRRATALAGLKRAEPKVLRGRATPVAIWALRPAPG